MKRIAIIAAAVALVGCASTPRQIIDTRGVDLAQYQTDTEQCQAYAAQVDVGGSAVESGVGGALLGGIIGGLIGGRDGAIFGAKVFGVTGAAEGAAGAARDQRQVAARCMQVRGYTVLL